MSKIAFFKFASFSLINENLCKSLEQQFVDHDLELIDSEQIYSRRTWANLVYSFYYYFWDIVRIKRPVRGMVIHSPYYFRQLQRQVNEKLGDKDFYFTFQTQSLWDLSLKTRPHFVYTDHTELAYERYEFLDRPIYPQGWIDCERQVYENAQLIFTSSDFCSRSVVEDYNIDSKKVICVHSGINLNHYLFDASEKQYDSKNILFVGVHWKRKGGPQLVKAFEELKRRHPEASLTIVGIDPSQIEPKQRNLAGVIFKGYVASEQLKAMFMDAQVFCLPSLVDPSATALIEAYAYFLPVVATKVGGTPSRVLDGQTGLLADPGDVSGLIERLDELLSSPSKCRDFGANGNELMKANFTWTRVAQKIKDNIDEYMNGAL